MSDYGLQILELPSKPEISTAFGEKAPIWMTLLVSLSSVADSWISLRQIRKHERYQESFPIVNSKMESSIQGVIPFNFPHSPHTPLFIEKFISLFHFSIYYIYCHCCKILIIHEINSESDTE